MPEVISSFSLGNAANRARGNGVRSRIAQMISKSFSAPAAASVEAKGSLKTVTSTRSVTFDQSATLKAGAAWIAEMIRWMRVRGRHVLGAPGRTRAAHIMQFQPVEMECPG